ncbi:MAG: NAD(P)H-quinone oxidoreductase [Acidobacteria bacterium]|nr:NAD(P)H-quinone oxidoreductase [Acidobacteriota bacterium]
MKAVAICRYGDVSGLEYREVPDPFCGPGDLLVRVRATALNRADILQRQGRYPPPGPPAKFEIPGLEFAGEVETIGSEVDGFHLGDRVMGITVAGGHAEKLAVPAGLAMRIPDSLDWRQAASIPEVFITAHDALVTQVGLASGESLLVHAAGSGVGTAAIQVAREAGADPIIGTAGSDTKLERARELGLSIGVNYHQQDFAEAVGRATAGRGVDVVLDVVGAEYWERNIDVLAPRGRMILVGLLGGARTQANLGPLLAKRLTIRGTTLRARSLEEKKAATRAFERSILPLLAEGRIRPVVDRIFPIAEIRAAHEFMESGANFGKIVLDVT